jgi:phage terminase large subunit
VVHPRCANTIREMRLYSYKVDRLTQDVLPVVADANNHWIDAIRYSVSSLIKRGVYNIQALI